MAGPAFSVSPYWELTFDADGDPNPAERAGLLTDISRRGVQDLIVFAHGWNNDRTEATALYNRFFAPIPALAPQARLGYAGVIWPSMRFCDEPIPNYPATAAVCGPTLDDDTHRALLQTFPGKGQTVERLAQLLAQRPAGDAGLTEFGQLVRSLVAPPDPQEPCAADTGADELPQMFSAPAPEICDQFAQALAALQDTGESEEFSLPNPWDGAKELLRQATYYEMKRRAGTVGENGLGPFIGQLAAAAPGVRVHLVGHSFGGRLVSFALRGLPAGVRSVKSVTLLQGAFSHYAFAASLPFASGVSGVLKGQEQRIDGPLVCCYSSYDEALGTLYPLASSVAGDDRTFTGEGFGIGQLLGAKWGAMGHDGVQSVPGTKALSLAQALGAPLPVSGCVNVDAAAVVRQGGPPSGAHSDIVHPELARVVLAAGRVH